MSEYQSNNINNEQYQIRLSKLNALREKGINPYPASVNRTMNNKDLQEKYKDIPNETVTEDVIFVVGRVMSIRNSGMFIDLVDGFDKIQVYLDLKSISEHNKLILDNLDIGDFINVEGLIRRTKRGELTINTHTLNIISKALMPLPDQYYGLHDTETRYRQRYIDLIINKESKEVLLKRSKLITYIREVLVTEDFLEVETPMLHPIPGGAIAKPFVTHHNALGIDLYLRIAPELYLKKLIIGGLSEKIFEINRCFRNEGISTRHNPEFTSIELYQAYANFNDMINITEKIIISSAEKLNNENKVLKFGDKEIDFTGPWPRISMSDLVKKYTNIDFANIKTLKEAQSCAKSIGIKDVESLNNIGKVLEAIFGEKVESHLINPIHVTYLPTDISPLSKVCDDDSTITERFETYVNGWEIANGFSELNDPIDQRARFVEQAKSKESGDEEAHGMDESFLTSLEYAMPPTGGLGIGIDRLAMLLTNSHSIREVIAFPTLKPLSE
jgi:lysyl-tRNA synthetase class 2